MVPIFGPQIIPVACHGELLPINRFPAESTKNSALVRVSSTSKGSIQIQRLTLFLRTLLCIQGKALPEPQRLVYAFQFFSKIMIPTECILWLVPLMGHEFTTCQPSARCWFNSLSASSLDLALFRPLRSLTSNLTTIAFLIHSYLGKTIIIRDFPDGKFGGTDEGHHVSSQSS